MNDVAKARHAVMSNVVLATRMWRKLAQKALADHGISQARATPLVWVYRLGGGVRQNSLAGYVGIEGTSLVRLLDELSAAGLLVRREDPGDRRAKTIWLTREGERLAEKVEDVLDALRQSVMRDVADADIDATLRVCGAVERAMKQTCSRAAEAVDLVELDDAPAG